MERNGERPLLKLDEARPFQSFISNLPSSLVCRNLSQAFSMGLIALGLSFYVAYHVSTSIKSYSLWMRDPEVSSFEKAFFRISFRMRPFETFSLIRILLFSWISSRQNFQLRTQDSSTSLFFLKKKIQEVFKIN